MIIPFLIWKILPFTQKMNQNLKIKKQEDSWTITVKINITMNTEKWETQERASKLVLHRFLKIKLLKKCGIKYFTVKKKYVSLLIL